MTSETTGRMTDQTLPWHASTGADDGPLVVLVHGTMDRAAGMLPLARRLDERMGGRLHIVRYDRRGYGRSTHLAPYDMGHQVGDLAALLDGRRAVLVGHSFGGNVALAAATRMAELVAGVAVYETPLSWEPWWPRRSASRSVGDAGVDAAAAAEVFMRRLIGDDRWEALPERTRLTRRAEGPAMVGELGDIRAHPPWSASDVRVPLVVGCGERGLDHHRSGMRRLAAEVPGAVFVELAGTGHAAPVTDAAQFVDRMIVPLLDTVGPPWAG